MKKELSMYSAICLGLIILIIGFVVVDNLSTRSSHSDITGSIAGNNAKKSALGFPDDNGKSVLMHSATSGNASPTLAPAGTNPIEPVVTHELPATVEIGEKKYDLKPNPIGSYPRITVSPKAVIPIHIQAKPGESVQEQVLDGGGIDGKILARLQQADNAGSIDFNFKVKASPGSYRLAVYHAGQREIFDFWVGPELPQRVSVNK